MVSYNPKEWFRNIFRFHKADTVQKLKPYILAVGAYSFLVAFLELEYWKLSSNNYLKNIPVMHTLLGFAISMLLVFRTNTAYDRWWEGNYGVFVNNSRNLAIKLSAILPKRKKYCEISSAKSYQHMLFCINIYERRNPALLVEDDQHEPVLKV